MLLNTKMSTARGSSARKRPQKYQNKTVFKNDLHDTSNKTKLLNTLEISGVCNRCKDIIDWKIKYKKYKPLTAPKKCVNCDQKAIKHAYHVLCSKCASEKQVCAKCCKSLDLQPEESKQEVQQNVTNLQSILKTLPERKRRTILRYLNKQQSVESSTKPELKSTIEDLLEKMDELDFDDDSSNDENFNLSDLDEK